MKQAERRKLQGEEQGRGPPKKKKKLPEKKIQKLAEVGQEN
jgi:hypothetical protein